MIDDNYVKANSVDLNGGKIFDSSKRQQWPNRKSFDLLVLAHVQTRKVLSELTVAYEYYISLDYFSHTFRS